MRGVQIAVVSLAFIGIVVVFLLLFSRIWEAMIKMILNIDREAVLNSLAMVNYYTALSMGDFYFFGYYQPLHTNKYSLESPEIVTLNYLTGNTRTTFNLTKKILETETRHAVYRFVFPKPNVWGVPYVVLEAREGIPMVKGMGREVTEYGYLGGSKIVEKIYYTCLKGKNTELVINSRISLKIEKNRIIVDGVPFDLKNLDCELMGKDVEGKFIEKIVFCYLSSGGGGVVSVHPLEKSLEISEVCGA